MIAVPDNRKLTVEEYFEWESRQEVRYEYINGEVFAMTGGTIPHNQVAINLAAILKTHLRGRGCKILGSDAKVGITEDGPFFYPDLCVSCDERDRNARRYILYPGLIAEVLSPATEGQDRGRKFQQYRRIETLQEYLLVDPDRASVECYRCNERGNWELFHVFCETAILDSDGIVLNLVSFNLQVPLSLVYEDVVFPTAGDRLS